MLPGIFVISNTQSFSETFPCMSRNLGLSRPDPINKKRRGTPGAPAEVKTQPEVSVTVAVRGVPTLLPNSVGSSINFSSQNA